jgi:type I restriction enzyme S subunit
MAVLSDVVDRMESGSRPKGGVKGEAVGIPSLGAEHLDSKGGFKFNKIKYIPEEFFSSQKRGVINKGDILVVKDGATTGKVSYVDSDFPFDKASINEHLFKLTINSDKADPKYAYYYLSSVDGKRQILSDFRGATVGGISRNFVKKVNIPLPPLGAQKQIVNILDESGNIRQKREESILLLNAYAKSMFIKMFGDPVSNPMKWDTKKFDELGTLDRGKSKHRPRNAPELLGGEHPLIQTGDVAKANMYIEGFASTYSDMGLKQSKKWPAGTLCITIAANIAKTGILAFDACFPDSVVGFTADDSKTNTVYIHYWMSFFQKILEANAPESAQKNINLRILRELRVIAPPIELQERFKEIVSRCEKIKGDMLAQQQHLESQFLALMQNAFNGSL